MRRCASVRDSPPLCRLQAAVDSCGRRESMPATVFPWPLIRLCARQRWKDRARSEPVAPPRALPAWVGRASVCERPTGAALLRSVPLGTAADSALAAGERAPSGTMQARTRTAHTARGTQAQQRNLPRVTVTPSSESAAAASRTADDCGGQQRAARVSTGDRGRMALERGEYDALWSRPGG